MAELFSIMRAQRACRQFDPNGEVPDNDIEEMLEAAVHAPSPENRQPWYFVAVRDHQIRSSLTRWWTETWQAGGSDYAREVATSDAMYADLQTAMGPSGFAAAPLIMIVCLDTERVPDIWAASAIYPVVQNLLLAANALGYGSCLTTGTTTFAADRIRQELDLPETISPVAAVYIGRPAKKLGVPRRRPATEVTFRERFGEPW